MKRYAVTFKETKKYNPYERTNIVQAQNEAHAENLIHATFNSFHFDQTLGMQVPSNRIEIIETKKVKDKKAKTNVAEKVKEAVSV